MITINCPGCGDTHLCPGTTAAEPEPAMLDLLRAFVADTFDLNPLAYVSSAGAYLAYLNWCTDHQRVPMSQRRFIPAMGTIGYPRIKRSTMRLAGLSPKQGTRVGRHAAEALATV